MISLEEKERRRRRGRRSRTKGKRGELMAVHMLRPVYPEMERQYNQARRGSEAPDIDCKGCPFWFEVKFSEGMYYASKRMAAIKQAEAATDGRPVVLIAKMRFQPWIVYFRQELLTTIPVLLFISPKFIKHHIDGTCSVLLEAFVEGLLEQKDYARQITGE